MFILSLPIDLDHALMDSKMCSTGPYELEYACPPSGSFGNAFLFAFLAATRSKMSWIEGRDLEWKWWIRTSWGLTDELVC